MTANKMSNTVNFTLPDRRDNGLQPSDGQSVSDLVKHADQGVIWSVIGWIIGGLTSAILALLSYLGVREARRTSELFRWKDDTVDPFMADVPKVYATKEDIKTYIFTPNTEDHKEIKERLEGMDKTLQEMRGMMVKEGKG